MAVIPGATNKLKALELSKFSEEATYEYVDIDSVYTIHAYNTL